MAIAYCRAIVAGVCFVKVFCVDGYAQEHQPDRYLESMGAVHKHLEHKKARSVSRLDTRNSSAPHVAFSHQSRVTFKQGQKWIVELLPKANSDSFGVRSSSMSSPVKALRFSFEVLRFDSETGLAQIRVQPDSSAKNRIAGPPVDHLVLAINDKFFVTRREVRYTGSTPARSFEGDGRDNISLGFDIFPLDLPNIESMPGAPVQDLPSDLADLGGLENAIEFRFSDLYARPVRVIWRKGAPWPDYIQNSAGVARLVSVEGT